MPLKVVHIIPTLDQGGAEKQLCLLSTHLDRSRFDVHVVVLTHSGPREAELRQQGIPVHLIGKRSKFDPWAYRRLKLKLAELQPDIVHTWLFAANAYGRTAALANRVPVIIAGERCVDPWKQWWQLAIDRHLLRRTSAVVTNTSAVVDFYAQRGLSTERFVVIPNAVEVPTGRRLTAADVCQRLQLPPRKNVVLAIGRLWPQKGYPDLIWAGELLRVACPDTWLVIIGDGPQRARLQHYRDQVRAEDAVRFVGQRTDAHELLSGASLLWNGSLYEGQSNTILEAMAWGIPVVATDIPGTRDLVVPEVTGCLYNPGDVATLTRSSVRLLEDPSLAGPMGTAARQRVQGEFSLQLMVQRHTELYQQLYHQAQPHGRSVSSS